jgi:hypothetical protein
MRVEAVGFTTASPSAAQTGIEDNPTSIQGTSKAITSTLETTPTLDPSYHQADTPLHVTAYRP